MKLTEILKNNAGYGYATISTKDGKYIINLYGDDTIRFSSRNSVIPINVLLGDDWEIKYKENYHIDDAINALAKLNPDLITLKYKSEWGCLDRTEVKGTLQAVARSLGYKIKIE